MMSGMPNLGELTSSELRGCTDAIDYLLSGQIPQYLHTELRIKLRAFRTELTREAEDRKKIAAAGTGKPR